MSELKDYDIMDIEAMDDERLEKSESGKIQVTRVYIKQDVDKVIADLKTERDEYRYNLSCARNEIHNMQEPMREDIKVIAELKADYKEACDRLQTANLIKDEQIAATRHQKYKRCLAMAKWCESEAYIHEHGSDYDEDLVAWFGKWHNRWRKIAGQFKEAK